MKKIILIGSGGHCKSCIEVIELEDKYKIIGILDMKEKIGEEVYGYKIIGSDEDIEKNIKEDTYFLITIGQLKTAELRKKIFNKLIENKAEIGTVISPLSHVSKHAEIGKGTIILNNVLVNSGAKIGENCIINSMALIEHDAKIGNHCHISTGARINGGVEVRDETFVGSGVTTK